MSQFVVLGGQVSNKIEVMIEESNFKNLVSLSYQELFIIWITIEDEHIIDFIRYHEATRWKNSRKGFQPET